MNRTVGTIGFCAAGVMALLCGCASPDPERELFNRVSSELDPNGSYYAVQNTVYLKQALKNLRKDAEKQIWDLPVPQKEQERLQLYVSAAELFCRTSGLAEIEGVGASSRCIGEKQFRNTIFWALPAHPQGALWQMLPQENRLSVSDLGALPENTTAAGFIELDPQALEQKIRSLYPEMQGMLTLPLLRELKGIWRFALIAEPDCNPVTGHGIHLLIALSDPQKKVFKQVAGILQLIPKCKVDRVRNKIEMAPFSKVEMAPCGILRDGIFYIFSSPRAAKLFGSPRKLKDNKAFQKTAADFPQSGIGVFYFQNGENLRTLKMLNLNLNCGFDQSCSAGILERKAGGLKWSSNNPYDWNVSALQALLAPAAFLLEPLILAPPKAQEQAQKQAQTEEEEEPQAPAPQPKKEIVNAEISKKHMKNLTVGLHLYASDHKKRFPEKAGIAGLKELGKTYLPDNSLLCPDVKHANSAGELSYENCDYLYFGNSAEKKAPLLIELPGIHGDFRLVVGFQDGSVQLFDMEKTFSVRKAVSFLHTKYHYEENEFLRLMEIAAEFDKILEL